MRVIALLAAYNERRFIDSCLTHLSEQGVHAYLIDNGSTDDTIELAQRHLGEGLLGIESFPRGAGDSYDWRGLLTRKEELARELDADWFMHLDPDEFRFASGVGQTLAEGLAAVERAGFNAVAFDEFSFVPTIEEPDHDHPDFRGTLRSYYYFAPRFVNQLKAWKATEEVELAWSAGHEARFADRRIFPQSFPMRHYLFLSVPHAIEKYVERRYDPAEIESGWHAWRSKLTAEAIRLPSLSELRMAEFGAPLDASEPRRRHLIASLVQAR